jgi:hypothetical protein
MQYLYKKFYLNIDIKLFFLASHNIFILLNKFFFKIYFMPSFFFFSINNFSFFFNNKFYFKSFLSHFSSNYKLFFFFYFFRLKLRGLGYRIKPITKTLIRFFIGTTNYYFFHVPLDVFVKAKRRRILIISSNKYLLKTVFLNLIFLKKLIPYKLRGLFFPRQIILMKPGKKRF